MHTGSHKLNNALGQCLLAKRMGKPRIIAETGAGQHGVATATACALLGPGVRRLHGHGGHAPPDAQRAAHAAARRDGQRRRRRLAHAQGGGLGRDPRLGRQRRRHALRDRLVRRPGAVPGARARPAARHRRRGARAGARALRPAAVARRSPAWAAARTRSACSSRSSTTPRSSWSASRRRARGWTPAATARRSPSAAAAACCTAPTRRSCRTRRARSPRRTRSRPAWTIPASGPEHAWLRDSGRARYDAVTDAQALDAFRRLAELEGIIPALESAHAVAWVLANPPAGERPARADLPLGPRRQGPRRGAGAAGVSVAAGQDTIAAAFAASGKRAALMPYLMGGFPDLDALARDRRGLRGGAAPTSSSSACRSPTRSPTAR